MTNNKLKKLQQEIRDLIEEYDPNATWGLYLKDSSTADINDLNEEGIDVNDAENFINKQNEEILPQDTFDKLLVAMSSDTSQALLTTIIGLRGVLESINDKDLTRASIALLSGKDPHEALSSTSKSFGLSNDLKSSVRDSNNSYSPKNTKSSRGTPQTIEFRRKYNCDNLQELVSLGVETSEKDETYIREKAKILQLFKSGGLLKYVQKKIKEYSEEE